MTIAGFDILLWFHVMSNVFLTLAIVFFVGAIVVFIYTRYYLHQIHAAHEAHSHAHGVAHGGTTHGDYHPVAAPQHDASTHGEATPEQGPLSAQWNRIKMNAESIREAEWKLSIIEADKVVDDALKELGYEGESMGERLMMIKPDKLMSLQDLWDAHKLRNLVVHDASYRITHEQVMGAIHSFEKVLRELGKL